MTTAVSALASLPAGLRDPLLAEYRSILQNFMEHRWSPSELSGGKFCEIVFTILDGHAKGSYDAGPSKPRNFVSACRALESNTGEPRSFQIMIPRVLPALYEIRNSRGVGHAGGDVDPNHMDSVAVLSTANWVMAELVRVLHDVSVTEAQKLVDSIVERRVPLVWHGENVKRVLDPTLTLKDQLLLLIASSPSEVSVADLQRWAEFADPAYCRRLLRELHSDRLVELSQNAKTVEILPPGSDHVEQIVSEHAGQDD